jgi:NADPH:quinone reductase-like Zn-dependent oxidoreductase
VLDLVGGETGLRSLPVIAASAEDGALRVHVAKTVPLAQAARAHELGESGRTQVVLTIASTDALGRHE